MNSVKVADMQHNAHLLRENPEQNQYYCTKNRIDFEVYDYKIYKTSRGLLLYFCEGSSL